MATKHITDLQVVQAVQQWQTDRTGPRAHELLAEWTGQPAKVCFRALERADRHGLLDYGVSLGTAWLTPEGHALLASATEGNGDQS